MENMNKSSLFITSIFQIRHISMRYKIIVTHIYPVCFILNCFVSGDLKYTKKSNDFYLKRKVDFCRLRVVVLNTNAKTKMIYSLHIGMAFRPFLLYLNIILNINSKFR